MDSSLRNPAQIFLTEAEDLLIRIEEIALELDGGGNASDLINPLFRAFHTIKGSGSMFGFDTVAQFTHHVETALDQVREGRAPLSKELIGLILRAKDHIKALLDATQSNQAPPLAAGAELIASLNTLLPAAGTGAGSPSPAPGPGSAKPSQGGNAVPPQTYQIHFRPSPGLMVAGSNPIALLNELRELGDCQIMADAGGVPPLEQLQPDQCYLAWDMTLVTSRELNSIKDVFMFVEDGSELKIEANGVSAPATANPVASASPPPNPAAAAPEKPVLQPASATLSRKFSSKDSSVRVPSERLDRLVNLVGELVMNQSRLSQIAAVAKLPDLAAPVEDLERLVDELRDNVLGIRMMPIGATFNRFKRLVHDLSAELAKEIDLVTEGEDTELDKTVLDQLGDPLVHLIRNSLDHGIELPEKRVSVGKPRRGIIRLAATHVGSNVVITITDDGRGIDADAVRAKAVEKGLIAADAKLSEPDMYELIFRPGFSTAEKITSVSGRGVGMDVVKRQFEALRGRVVLSSKAGQGTTITLTLPLTLAIIDGLLVEIGRDQFIVPMSVVTENVELHRSERSRNNGRNVIAVRGDLVPYVHLREAFAVAGTEPEIEKVVIARHGEDRVGFVVDRVVGNHQTVIQPLGKFYQNIDLVSGATIMGDGRVALILDVAGLVRMAGEQPTRPSPTLLVRPEDLLTQTNNSLASAPSFQGAGS